MSLTVDQLVNQSFGYLNGDDLTEYSPPQLLIKQYEVKRGSLQKGCDVAYSELISLLNTRYNLAVEFAKRGFTNATGAATATFAATSSDERLRASLHGVRSRPSARPRPRSPGLVRHRDRH